MNKAPQTTGEPVVEGHAWPAGHSKQEVSPSGEYSPDKHATGVDAVDAHSNPLGHATQIPSPSSEYSVAPQSAGVWDGSMHDLPAGHGVQDVVMPRVLYEPVGHA